MNRDEIIAIAFSFVNSEKVMKERYNKYHNDYGKYITMLMLPLLLSINIINVEVFIDVFLI